MILVDANLLIYAIDSDSPQHWRARPWLERTLSGTDPLGLAWIVILAFIRITTRQRIMRRLLPPAEAFDYVNSWLQQPCVEVVVPGQHHWPILCNLLEATGTAGNLTLDAHIAALALERGACICLTDYDFAWFPGIRHVNPLDARLSPAHSQVGPCIGPGWASPSPLWRAGVRFARVVAKNRSP